MFDKDQLQRGELEHWMNIAKQNRLERDSARRFACRLLAAMSAGEAMVQYKSPRSPKSFAKRLRWDCFEQSDSVQNLTPEADSADTP